MSKLNWKTVREIMKPMELQRLRTQESSLLVGGLTFVADTHPAYCRCQTIAHLYLHYLEYRQSSQRTALRVLRTDSRRYDNAVTKTQYGTSGFSGSYPNTLIVEKNRNDQKAAG